MKVDSTAASDWLGDLLAIGLYEDDIGSEGRALLSHSQYTSYTAVCLCCFHTQDIADIRSQIELQCVDFGNVNVLQRWIQLADACA